MPSRPHSAAMEIIDSLVVLIRVPNIRRIDGDRTLGL